jgi:predicted transcriptional regulator
MSDDLTPDVAQLLSVVAQTGRSSRVLAAVCDVFATTDPETLAAGISQPELAVRAGTTDRSVRRALRRLEALGVVETVKLDRNRLGYIVDDARLDIVRKARS